jgi:hypothetical protein
MIDVIETAATRIDHALGLLIDPRYSTRTTPSPVMNALSLSVRRAGERLCRRHGHSALVEAAMLIAVRNPNSTRNDRITLLETLWSAVDMQTLAVRDIPTTAPRLDTADGEAQHTEIAIMKKAKKTSRKKAKKTKRIAAHKQAAAVKRST